MQVSRITKYTPRSFQFHFDLILFAFCKRHEIGGKGNSCAIWSSLHDQAGWICCFGNRERVCVLGTGSCSISKQRLLAYITPTEKKRNDCMLWNDRIKGTWKGSVLSSNDERHILTIFHRHPQQQAARIHQQSLRCYLYISFFG